MFKKLLPGLFILILSLSSHASKNCFIATKNGNLLQEEGTGCKTRYAPNSTFKIPLALMGYDAQILKNETHPQWPFKEGYDDFLATWKVPHNPATWMRDSCVWYSQVLTQKLGMNKFQYYVTRFEYGNLDVSGDKGKNNVLTHSWLSSSLQISPEEQIIFLQKLLDNKLSVSTKAHEMTKKIMYKEELFGGWKLYGKTGNGKQLDKNGLKTDLQHGWFVGWIEKDGEIIIFANHIVDDKKQDVFASFRAKNEVQNKLFYIIDGLAKK